MGGGGGGHIGACSNGQTEQLTNVLLLLQLDLFQATNVENRPMISRNLRHNSAESALFGLKQQTKPLSCSALLLPRALMCHYNGLAISVRPINYLLLPVKSKKSLIP